MAAPAKNAVSTGKPKVAGSVYIGSAAAGVCARAGNGYTVEAYTTAQRAAARVKAEADAAERENRENNTLLRALG